jgi:hypothetical protein
VLDSLLSLSRVEEAEKLREVVRKSPGKRKKKGSCI